MPTLKAEGSDERKTAREALSALLEGETELADSTREATAAALADTIRLSSGITKDEIAERRECLTLLVASIKGDSARAFAEQALATGSDEDKTAVLHALLKPGALRGGSLYEMAYELTKTASIPEALKPSVIRRIRGKKGEDELMAFIRDSKDKRVLAAAAVEVQNLRKPELMGEVIARLDEMGMLKDEKSMPWFSGNILSQHLKKAQGVELVRALKVVWTRPSLTRSTFKSVSETLASADPAVRRMAARLVPDAVKYEGAKAEEGEQVLSARLEVETDPSVKGELEAVLGDIRRTRRPPEVPPAPEPVVQETPAPAPVTP